MHRRTRTLPSVVTCVLLTACGGGDGSTAASQATTTSGVSQTTSPSTTITVPLSTTAPIGPTTTPARILVPTTAAPVAGETMVDRSFIAEKTTDVSVDQSRINGVSYPSALIIYSSRSPARVEIDAARSRRRFLGTLGVPDTQRSSSSVQVDISLDNGPVVFSEVVNFGESKSIDLPVPNVLRIKIAVTSKGSESTYVAIGNPRFA